ncbi:MAG: dihydroorotate dehydrogenase electron transfer subunit [Oscillospiraceae bacterium]|jgi:dihydroorotate dehydrogenase electron transfer subunit|nr:dihydroorotate dehydrogenase electron transfer subunit [Oscillospiraceae bacterium]
MRYTQETAKIMSKCEIAPGVFDITVLSPVIAKSARAGQFVNVLCNGLTLRRPISLCGFNREQGTLRLVFEVRGKGTDWLSGLKTGDRLDIIGPLGHGFTLYDKNKKAVIVGGGIGLPPLVVLANHYGENATVISGFRTSSAAILQSDLANTGATTILCTDDGSAGFHGFTTQALDDYLINNACDVIYTCGPKIMMRGIARLAQENGIVCQVSLEERMGCGVGACLCCVCATKDSKGKHFKRVCVNGPVFMATEVEWND